MVDRRVGVGNGAGGAAGRVALTRLRKHGSRHATRKTQLRYRCFRTYTLSYTNTVGKRLFEKAIHAIMADCRCRLDQLIKPWHSARWLVAIREGRKYATDRFFYNGSAHHMCRAAPFTRIHTYAKVFLPIVRVLLVQPISLA